MNDATTDVKQCVDEMITQIRAEIANNDLSEMLMIGIHTGGVWIAERLHKKLNIEPPRANVLHHQ